MPPKKSLVSPNVSDFEEIAAIIENTRKKVFRIANHELIDMYWKIGSYVSQKVKSGKWGKSVVEDFAVYIKTRFVGIQGFSQQNIWRMKQFYETYAQKTKLAQLVRELGWTNNLLIMMAAKTDEEREFYLMASIKNSYSKRELERQIDSSLFERMMISKRNNRSFFKRNSGLSALRDSYVLEFLDIPQHHQEKELRKAIIDNLCNFILEFGKDFTLVGEEYKVQVGHSDFSIDLLFFNRELSCLVAVELKTTHFKPEHLGQLEFYLEALDRNVKKKNENPSVGLILCTGKDDEVVKYALSRSLSPALIAAYQTHLPKKELLENKLRELRELAEAGALSDHDRNDK